MKFRVLTLLAIFQRVAGRTLRGRVVVYTVVSTFLLVFVVPLAWSRGVIVLAVYVGVVNALSRLYLRRSADG